MPIGNGVIGPYRGVLPDSALASMEEQLSGACTVEIAAFDEFTKLLGDTKATADFDHIIFDTAPTGHTLRLAEATGRMDGLHRYEHDRHLVSGAACGTRRPESTVRRKPQRAHRSCDHHARASEPSGPRSSCRSGPV